MTYYEPLAYFHLITFWNLHNLVTILNFLMGLSVFCFSQNLLFNQYELKKFFEGSQDLCVAFFMYRWRKTESMYVQYGPFFLFNDRNNCNCVVPSTCKCRYITSILSFGFFAFGMVVGWFFFLKISFLKISFRNTIRAANSLDPDQARHFVGPDLGPNCFQSLSADDTNGLTIYAYAIITNISRTCPYWQMN